MHTGHRNDDGTLVESRTVALASLQREHVFRRFQLRVTDGPDVGASLDSTEEGVVTIGTAESNRLRLTDPTVSRFHCVIEAKGGRHVMRDVGSTNGVLLAGCRVKEIVLVPGATVRIGTTQLRFESLPGETKQALSTETRCGQAIGKSVAMRRVFAVVSQVADSNATVLLTGDTGTGKTLLAEAIHAGSKRASEPFVVVDCASLAESIVESELFGHEKGAFTGAIATRKGAFEAAHGGTLFLDEIGELPPAMQPKLLRALENRDVQRLGSTSRRKVDVRIVAATHQDLRARVNDGTFRADLFHRLNVVEIVVPSLKERPEDVELLANHFFAALTGVDEATLPAAVLESFRRRAFAGNIRELRAAVERFVLLGEASQTSGPSPRSDAPTPPRVPYRIEKERVVAAWEAEYLSGLLDSVGGNLSQAARVAATDRAYLRELLRKHKLRSI